MVNGGIFMKLYTKKAFLSSVMLAMTLFSLSSSFCSADISVLENNSLLEKVKVGAMAGIKRGATEGLKESAWVSLVIGFFAKEEVKLAGIVKIITAIVAVESMIGAGLGGLFGFTENTAEETVKKTEGTIDGSMLGGFLGLLSGGNIPIFVSGRIFGAIIGYARA